MAMNTKKNALDLFSGMNEVKKTEPVKKVETVITENTEDKTEQVMAPPVEKPFRINLNGREERSKKSHTLYFDEEVYRKLERMAKDHNLSVSETLDEILKQTIM